MGVGVRAQHAGDHELCAGEFLAQHAHERDGAAFAHVHRRFAEKFLAGVVDRAFQPRGEGGGVPAGAGFFQSQTHVCTIRWVFQQHVLQQFATAFAVQCGRQTQAKFDCGERTQHIAGRGQRRNAIHPGDRQCRPPCAVEHQLGAVAAHRGHTGQERELVEHFIAQHVGHFGGLCQTVGRDVHMQAIHQNAAGVFVFDA